MGVLGPGGCSCRGAVSPAQATEARFQGAQPLPVLLQGPHPAAGQCWINLPAGTLQTINMGKPSG